jgi:hypothetical protein
MTPIRYYVFRINREGPLWFAAENNFQDVKKRVDGVGCACLALDLMTGEKIVVTPRTI